MRILLLTGDRNTANNYRNAANEAGAHRLCTVNNVAQALELLFREPFDALLSDDAKAIAVGDLYNADAGVYEIPVTVTVDVGNADLFTNGLITETVIFVVEP